MAALFTYTSADRIHYDLMVTASKTLQMLAAGVLTFAWRLI